MHRKSLQAGKLIDRASGNRRPKSLAHKLNYFRLNRGCWWITGNRMKYSTLRRYVRFFPAKIVKYVGITVILWPIIGGFLIYNQLLPNLDWLNFSIFSVLLVLIIASPRRRKGLRSIAFKATLWGWRRRPHPKFFLIVIHFGGAFFMFAYSALSQDDVQFVLPAFAYAAVIFISFPLLFWRPLILRVLFGFDKRTKVFGILR